MKKELKNKLISLNEETFKILSFKAVSEGLSLKSYIEKILDAQANSIRRNSTLIELNNGNSKAISEDEERQIRENLGL
jgi:hypothetical protein